MKHFCKNKRHNYHIIIYGFIFLSFLTNQALALPTKHIAVPAEDITKQRLQKTSATGLFSHSTMFALSELKANSSSPHRSNSKLEISKKIYIDSKQSTPILFIGLETDQWHFTISNPSGQEIHNSKNTPENSITTENIHLGNQTFKGKQYRLPEAATGTWEIKLSREVKTAKTNSNLPQSTNILANESLKKAYLLIKGDTEYQLYSYLDQKVTTQNKKINLTAYMVHSDKTLSNRNQLVKQTPLQGVITKASANITTPSNKIITIKLRDDGLNGDKLAGDGRYSGQIPTDELGVYSSEVQIEGIRPDGLRYSRTTNDLYPIEAQSYRFKHRPARLKKTGEHTAIISVPVKQLTDGEPIFMAGEVWGTTHSGQKKLAAWVGGIVSPTKHHHRTNLNLNFDTRWLERERLQAPFELRALRLQTVATNTPIALKAKLRLKTTKQFNRTLVNTLQNYQTTSLFANNKMPVTSEMLMGSPPIQAISKASASTAPGKLMLVHGYCTSGNPFTLEDFSNTVQFHDPKQNRSHDEFARKIYAFGADLSSFGIVAHSQGGTASLHLLAKYWSGLDKASGGRKIQSVGTPYQGTSLAGSLAALGKIFGIGCGKNTDLTYTGAANWLATIPNWARAEVDYYTTSFTKEWWKYDYCNLTSELLLKDPEDGVIEKWAGQLPGGVNKGHKEGWCHSQGMRDPAQYNDTSRNLIMNNNAAR